MASSIQSWRGLLYGGSRGCRVAVAVMLGLGLFLLLTSTSWMYNPLDVKGVYKERLYDDYMEASQEYFTSKPTMVVMTVERKQPYIQAFLWSFLAFNPEPRPHLFIINRQDPNVPPSAYNMDGVTVRNATPMSSTGYSQWKRALYYDHIDALDICLEEDKPWCLVFEGDTILTDGFVEKFMRYVSQEKEGVSMVKLFVTDHWSGWSASDTPLFILLVVVVALAVSLYLRKAAPLLSRRQRYIWGIAAGLVFIFLVLVISKQTLDRVVHTRPGVRLLPTTVDASSVATAYPRESVQPLRDHLKEYVERESDPLGIDLEQYRWAQSHGRVLRTYPSLVQHIGVYSSSKAKNQGNFRAVLQDSAFIGPMYP